MAPSLKPPGKNGSVTAEDILHTITAQLPGPVLPPAVPLIEQLLPILVQLQSPQGAAAFLAPLLQQTAPDSAAILWAALAESLSGHAEATPALQRAQDLAEVLSDDPTGQCRAWGAIARAQVALRQDPSAAVQQAWEARRRAGPELASALLDDFLAMGDIDNSMRLLRECAPAPTPADVPRYADLCRALYAAGRLSEVLPMLSQRGDILIQASILRAATDAPIHAQDIDMVFSIVDVYPSAYRADLLESIILRWVDMGHIGTARRALERWDDTDSLIRLGMQAMLEDAAALAALQAQRDALLEIEEVAWHDTWRYRDLGRACGWAGDLSGTLSALEQVVDREDRMSALLSAARHAPVSAREPLLCAARGLAASMQDDRHRAEAVGHLAALQVSLGRRRAGLTQLEEASRLAVGVRRPRSDQGFARRSALESVILNQLRSDDLLGAFRTARKLRTKHMRNPHLAEIACRYAEQGDLGGVRCCLENMHPNLNQVLASINALTHWIRSGKPGASSEAA